MMSPSYRFGFLCDVSEHEKRTAVVPNDVKRMIANGFEVTVESGCGLGILIDDHAYREAGADVVDALDISSIEVMVSLQTPKQLTETLRCLSPGAVFVGIFDPLWMPSSADLLIETKVTAFSLDLVPRITRAQSMDVLSSMATIAGYEAVVLAASRLPQMFPLMMTAGGTLIPARVMVLGAGVAGLQACATARRLGAVVEAYDVRPEALEQIQSVGARAIRIDLEETGTNNTNDRLTSQQQQLAPYVAAADVLITTAAIPGQASPLLVTTEMIDAMQPGSVVIDLAAQRGGNCEITEADKEINHNEVTVLGPTNLASKCARHASQLLSHNMTEFLLHLAPEGKLVVDTDDEITSSMLVTDKGSIVNSKVLAVAKDSPKLAVTH